MAGRGVAGVVALALLVACGQVAAGAPAPSPAPPVAATEPQVDPARALLDCLRAPGQVQPIPPASAAEQIPEIAARIEILRGLPVAGRVEPTFLAPAEVSARAAAQLERDYTPEEADADHRILAALGAIAPDLDLRTAVAGLLSAQVLGFYDDDTGELVVATSDAGASLDPLGQTVLAHELVHAATDVAFGLPDALEDGSADEQLAALGLVEGDAVLTQERFARLAISIEQMLDALRSPERAAPPPQQRVAYPHVLTSELAFPYTHGAAFACALYNEGGLERLNASYRIPPTTSAQILFPRRFITGEDAVNPRDPAGLPAPWTRVRQDSFGAADLLWLFEAPGDDVDAALQNPLAAAGNWAGGELVLYTDGPRTAVALALVDRGVGELCDAVSDWYESAFPDDRSIDTSVGELLARDGFRQDGVVRCGEGEVRLGIAPDLATARILAA